MIKTYTSIVIQIVNWVPCICNNLPGLRHGPGPPPPMLDSQQQPSKHVQRQESRQARKITPPKVLKGCELPKLQKDETFQSSVGSHLSKFRKVTPSQVPICFKARYCFRTSCRQAALAENTHHPTKINYRK